MPFDLNQLPTWNKEGVEPPQSLKDNGWQPSQKPPADYFNWFFNKVYKALQSLFANAQHKEEKGQPNGYAALNAEGKVINADGSLAGGVQSVNGKTGAVTLTSSDVGASPTGHTHTFAEVTNKPTTLSGYGITDAISSSQKGAANGVASLDGSAKVPTTQLPSASTSAPGIVQLNDTVSSTSTTQAATANAVKQVNDAVVAHSADTASKFTNINLNIIDMAVELETLKGATLNGVTANIFIETFTNLNDINLMNGIYDNINKRLVL
ncbi:phage tail protein [Geobacillus subterraneus]|uniref:phage tail protein n=1 Tax=Geobacillus subterraneus TaxID=129338 RepID=UPI002AC97DBA|nr:phage tail protein [Geobacillus subterraneus]WPZ17780.1 phage tail protein [Geobacillus subterraneus]